MQLSVVDHPGKMKIVIIIPAVAQYFQTRQFKRKWRTMIKGKASRYENYKKNQNLSAPLAKLIGPK